MKINGFWSVAVCLDVSPLKGSRVWCYVWWLSSAVAFVALNHAFYSHRRYV